MHGLSNAAVYVRISEMSDFSETVRGGVMAIAFTLPLTIVGLLLLRKHSREKPFSIS